MIRLATLFRVRADVSTVPLTKIGSRIEYELSGIAVKVVVAEVAEFHAKL